MGCGTSKGGDKGEPEKIGNAAHGEKHAAPTMVKGGAAGKLTNSVLGKETEDVTNLYTLGRVLGRGQFGTTRLAVQKATGKEFACKSIGKRKLLTAEDVEDVRREVQIMHHLEGHPNIVKIFGAFEDKHSVHLVMELCSGGELFDRIVARGHYTEKDAAQLIRTIVSVVVHCHHLGVIHRDLKPENFLLADQSDHAELKATDFGLSAFFRPGQVFSEILGSAYYIAPEVLRRHYSKEADIWSCGVMLYILLCGVPPFWGETEQQIFDAILKGRLDFEADPWPAISAEAKDCVKAMLQPVHADPPRLACGCHSDTPSSRTGSIFEAESWPAISAEAKDCVKAMLQPDPKKRASADMILQHSWMRENGTASDRPLDNVILMRMRGFAGMNKLKKEAIKVIAAGMSPEEIAGLHALFQSLDLDDTKTITLEELAEGLRKQGSPVAQKELEALLGSIDIDASGTIDYEEFLVATVNLSQLEKEENMMRAFAHFDTDSSGFITEDELEAALRKTGGGVNVAASVREILSEVDKDNDGRIDYQEFCDMMRGQTKHAIEAANMNNSELQNRASNFRKGVF